MEFKAIIDAKARNATACAVVGVYEEGDLGSAARRIDAELGGMIGKLHADGDFSGKLGDILMLRSPEGAPAARVLSDSSATSTTTGVCTAVSTAWGSPFHGAASSKSR